MSKTRVFGFMPARMAASRFPGKPLYPILGRPMIEHCFERAKLYPQWDGIWLCTCDSEIESFAKSKDYPVIMTSDLHTRALERVAEAAAKCGANIQDHDLVLCVQGDEPLMKPDMIEAVIAPFLDNADVRGTILAIPIESEEQWRNPDILKIVSDLKNRVIYTSRSPLPYAKTFEQVKGVRRILGIFAFRYEFLKLFISLKPSPLEINESCDSNRFMDNGVFQHLAPYPAYKAYSVDSPSDIGLVESAMKSDPYFGKY